MENVTGNAKNGTMNITPGIEAILENVDSLIHVSDPYSCRVIYANRSFKNTFGNVTGRKCDEAIYRGKTALCGICDCQRNFPEMPPPEERIVHEYRSQANGKWYQASARKIPWKNGATATLVSASDIHKVKKEEEKMRRAVTEAKRSAEIKDKFVSMVSHNIRGPLGTILGFAKLLREKPEKFSRDETVKMLESMERGGKSILALTDEILDTSRIRKGKICPKKRKTHLRPLILEIFSSLGHDAEKKGISLVTIVPPDAFLVADRALLGEALYSIVSNAVKFCSRGDSVTVFIQKDKRPVLAVSDTGPGIPPVRIEKIFSHKENLSTIGTMGERGTGLGLPLARDMIEAHGGTLYAASEKGKGTTFYIDLPQTRPLIMLIEEEEVDRSLFRLFLDSIDAEIVEAESGWQALTLTEKNRPDLFVTGVKTPVTSGLNLIGMLKGNPATADVPIVAVMAHPDPGIRKKAFQMGADDIVFRPVTSREFIPRVRRFVE